LDDIPLSWLFTALFLLLLCSAFFSSSETSMMALNRYRLKHLKASGHRGATKAANLLDSTDKLIGLILICNNLVNFAAMAIATAICVRLYGDAGYLIATIGFTIIALIFAEITPKTFAAFYPEKIAFPASHILKPLQSLLFPFIVTTNWISNRLLKAVGGSPNPANQDGLSFDELRTLVSESGSQIPIKPRGMLMNILDLETMEIEDIMIPRNEIYAIDVNEEPQLIFDRLRASEYTRVLLYRDQLDDVVGVLHLRNTSRFIDLSNKEHPVDKRAMMEAAAEPYFVPEGTHLHTQLTNFQSAKRRVGIVVDEYGVVQGLIAIEDILEEIVGNYTTNFAEQFSDITQQDEHYIINGSTMIRDINKILQWQLPTDGPKTINGLLLEHLEGFPDGSGVSLSIGEYLFEILDLQDNRIHSVRAQLGH